MGDREHNWDAHVRTVYISRGDGGRVDDNDLTKVIAQVRADLQSAIAEGAGSALKFGLGDVELTLQFALTESGGGKVNFTVFGVGLGANGALSSEKTNTIKLVLKPTLRQPDGSYSSDFQISGPATKMTPTAGPRTLSADD